MSNAEKKHRCWSKYKYNYSKTFCYLSTDFNKGKTIYKYYNNISSARATSVKANLIVCLQYNILQYGFVLEHL